jgi:ABC-type nitrate/sulfonate/bicarbonate transport system permease component
MSTDQRKVADKPPAIAASRTRRPLPRTFKTLIVPIIAILVWWGLTSFTGIREVFLPSPKHVAEVAWAIKGELLSGFFISMQMILGGLFIGGTLGITAGLLFGISRHARDYFEFTVDLIRPIPLFALIPLFILWFGIGKRPQIALVSLGVFLLLSIITIEAIRNVPPVYVRAALTLGANRVDVYKTVVVRAISPHLIAGIRLAGAYSFGLDVAAEFSGSQEGLGFIMIIRGSYLDTAGVVLIVLIFGVLAIAFDQTIKAIFQRATRWSPRESGAGIVSDMLGKP